MHPCTLCPKTYKRIRSLNHHKKWIHDGVTYPCASCPKVFSRSDYRRHHDARVHRGLGFPCPICLQTFTARKGVRHHQQTVHKLDPRANNINPASLERLVNDQTAVTPEEELEQPFRLEDYLKIWENLDTDAVIAELIKDIPLSDVTFDLIEGV